jgi:hypothetical protein
MKTTRLKLSKCLRCGKQIDAATAFDGKAVPKPGDITICIGCNHVMAFAQDLSMRELTDAELVAVSNNKQIWRLSYAVAKLIQERKKGKPK